MTDAHLPVSVSTAFPVDPSLDGVAPSLLAKDASLWGPEAEPEAAQRLGWLDLPNSSQELVPRLAELRSRMLDAGLDHIVLAGMGGSSLAPEVITRTAGTPLTILDTTDPHQVGAAVADRLDRTVLVVASKSGGTLETDSHRRVYEQAFRDAGLSDDLIAQRIVVVTDPGSPLEKQARDAGYEVVLADPDVGGRYSALSAFGLVPSALAGADVDRLLADARILLDALGSDTGNPGLELGSAFGRGVLDGRDKLAIADAGVGIVGFGDWAEQLVAESTGKNGTGLLPVVVEGVDAPGFADASSDVHRLVLGESDVEAETNVTGSLGAQFLLWEFATAVAGRMIDINPFDQPNVAESKENTNAILDESGDGPLPEGEPSLVVGSIDVHGDVGALGSPTDLAGVLGGLIGQVEDRGYLAVMAYLDRGGDRDAAHLRAALADRLHGRAVTFGWGPRFLHSTGQFHKGGPQNGVFLQITGAVESDIDVPGRPYSLGRLQLAQALGDLRALSGRGRPVVRLHLRNRREGLRELLAASGSGT